MIFKVFFVSLFSLLISSCRSNFNGTETEAVAYKLVWSDHFEYEGLPDSSKWSFDVGGHGWGNKELQTYTEKRIENARVSGGKLIIEARKENMNGMDYTSARVVSRGKGDWLYGKIEVKARLPYGTGTWPAIWMMPTESKYGKWPKSGEIDIMEHVGFEQGRVHGTVHTEAFNHMANTQKSQSKYVPDVHEAFHLYAIEWTLNKIDFFIDNEKYFTLVKTKDDPAEWPFDHPFYLILNIAVGGSWGGQKGIDDTIWPQRMEIDYVKVFQYE